VKKLGKNKNKCILIKAKLPISMLGDRNVSKGASIFFWIRSTKYDFTTWATIWISEIKIIKNLKQ